MTPIKLGPGWSNDGLGAAFIVQLVALGTGIGAKDINAPTRHGAEAARARQLAMYLAYTAWAWPLARVAAAFGRDRSTASYACRKVEDRRDDARYDAFVGRLERCARTAPVSEASGAVAVR